MASDFRPASFTQSSIPVFNRQSVHDPKRWTRGSSGYCRRGDGDRRDAGWEASPERACVWLYAVRGGCDRRSVSCASFRSEITGSRCWPHSDCLVAGTAASGRLHEVARARTGIADGTDTEADADAAAISSYGFDRRAQPPRKTRLTELILQTKDRIRCRTRRTILPASRTTTQAQVPAPSIPQDAIVVEVRAAATTDTFQLHVAWPLSLNPTREAKDDITKASKRRPQKKRVRR